MRILMKAGLLFAAAAIIFPVAMEGAGAAETENIMMKAGETVDLGPVYWQSNCHSTLKNPPTADVMEGPSDVTISVRPQKVMPRKFDCAKPIDGAELLISATKDIKARTQAKLYIRINYPTKDGDRQHGREINLTLFPLSEGAASTQVAK